MKTVTVQASRTYDVVIDAGILPKLGTYAQPLCKGRTAAIVSDTNVWPLWGACAETSLKEAGFRVISFVFPAGESSKNGAVYLELVNFLAENGLTRGDLLIALGGGVVGDLTGFAAATYLRGVPYVQVPTTLLAAVDSSVGGKTAIDLPAGKNLCGAFYQPSLVLCDTDTLTTLPKATFRDGCAEVIKYAVLYDPDLLSVLERDGLHFCREEIIARCVEWKRRAVTEDEFDTGARMKLNLGHTLGHGIETGSNFRLSHGQAVAIGIAMVCRASHFSDTGRILRLLEAFGLPVATGLSAEEIFRHALGDKKRSGDTVNLILPIAIGDCAIVPTPVNELKSFIEEGL